METLPLKFIQTKLCTQSAHLSLYSENIVLCVFTHAHTHTHSLFSLHPTNIMNKKYKAFKFDSKVKHIQVPILYTAIICSKSYMLLPALDPWIISSGEDKLQRIKTNSTELAKWPWPTTGESHYTSYRGTFASHNIIQISPEGWRLCDWRHGPSPSSFLPGQGCGQHHHQRLIPVTGTCLSSH